MEEWRDVEGYEGFYQVSNRGEVRSLDRIIQGRWGDQKIVGGIISQTTSKKGYKRIKLCRNSISRTTKVHRLVAEMFLDNSSILPQVDHMDGNKTNNRVDNLRWCTNRENSEWYYEKQDSTSEYVGVSWDKDRSKWKAQIKKEGIPRFLGRFDSELEAREAYLSAVG
jgi:hypothetical protein